MRLLFMNSGQTRTRLVKAGVALSAAALIAGCGSAYRSVITPINSSGPAAQPSSLAVVVSSPSTTSPGIATVLDYSGDTIMAQAPIGPGPTTFSLDATGTYGYTFNSDGTLTNFPVSNNLQAKNVQYTTMPAGTNPNGFFSPSAGLWATDLDGNNVDVFSGYPQSFKQTIQVASTPIMILGPGTIGERNYAISQSPDSLPADALDTNGVDCNNNPAGVTSNGVLTPIETSSLTADTPIKVGKCPVYAVMSADGRRLFVLNRGDDTISVINVQTNALDKCSGLISQNGQPVTCHPVLPLSTTAVAATGVTLPVGSVVTGAIAGPVYAEYNQATNQLVVSNYDGSSVSIIDVSMDEYGNDSATFGTTYTVPVGANPASVTVLYDGSRAYTANQTDGTVTIVNVPSHTVEKTLSVVGHPRTVVSTQNSQFGKVYVASPDSPYVTILSTINDGVDTVNLNQGNVVDVRATTQNANSGNAINTSRKPGYGQPCYLPGTLASASIGTCTTLPK
jgi:DNA-binding beta-propeller fold protein YncE